MIDNKCYNAVAVLLEFAMDRADNLALIIQGDVYEDN